MNQITFPYFNLKLNIPSIAFTLFRIKIYWYAIIIVFAITIGIIICKINEKKFTIGFDNLLSLLIIALPISFISARLYYILFNLNTYIGNPKEILNIRRRRTCNIWWNNRICNNIIHILQKERSKNIRTI